MTCRICFIFILIILCAPHISRAQAEDSSRLDKALAFPDKIFGLFQKKAAQAEEGLNKKTDRYLSKLQRREEKLRLKMWKRDSLTARALFPDIKGMYGKLKSSTTEVGNYATTYSGHLDSLTASLKFLQKRDLAANPDLKKALDQYTSLQKKLNASEQIKKQLTQREQLLKQQFSRLGMVKELKNYQKELYYYRAQVQAYKQTFEDPSKLEAKLLEVLSKLPQFRSFFRDNSLLGSFFALPGGDNQGMATAPLVSLQTRSMVGQSLTERFGSSAAVTNQLRTNLQAAKGQLSTLKAKVSSLSQGSYGNTSSTDIPSFKPNSQKTKPFLQRLEWGTNMQSQKARYFFPVTSDIGLSLGYKINDGASAGLGLSYKIGWGRSWSNISFNHQGLGLRSYVEYKFKGAFYFSGGYELNYFSAFKNIDQLKDHSAWQKSGLAGISKKYVVSKKLKGDMKLLWDFLSYSQIPRTQAILFRIGYSLK